MLCLGCDIATHIGLALTGGEEDRVKSIEINQKGFSRLHSIAGVFENTLDIWKPDIAVIEAFAFFGKKSVNSFITVVEVTTIIKVELHRLKIPWVEVRPATLKKWVTSHGDADKSKMAYFVESKWGFKSNNTDLVDAFALAKFGLLGVEEMLKFPGVVKGV